MANRQGSIAAGNWQSGNNTSTAVDVSDLESVVVILGATVALSGGTSVALQISMDGTTFVTWDSAKTAVGAYATIPSCKMIRASTSAYSAGTPVMLFSGKVATA